MNSWTQAPNTGYYIKALIDPMTDRIYSAGWGYFVSGLAVEGTEYVDVWPAEPNTPDAREVWYFGPVGFERPQPPRP